MIQSKDKNVWMNKKTTKRYATYRWLTSDLKTHRLKVKDWKKMFHANGNQKQTGIAILTSDKIDF